MTRVPGARDRARDVARSRPILLDVRHARLVRGDAEVLHGVSFRVHAGEHTAIVGPNGAGKSSLLSLLTLDSYARVDAEGDSPVTVFGRDRWDVSELRAVLGVVTADLHEQFVGDPWIGRASALDVVTSGLLSSHGVFSHHTVSAGMRERARAALEQMGAAHLAARSFTTLSTGEARRVLIARALVSDPRLLVLDEPTSGLDVVARHRFMEHVRSIARSGATLVVVTQHLDEIVPEIGRVILLAGGHVVGDGPKADILTEDRLGRLFGAPVSVTVANGYYHVHPR